MNEVNKGYEDQDEGMKINSVWTGKLRGMLS